MHHDVAQSRQDIKHVRDDAKLNEALDSLNRIILGKAVQIRLCLACMMAGGHLLIEDIPGVGKTTLAHALARILGLSYQRIQFTSDLLPADITGVSVYDREQSTFRFHPGPIFSNLVLADEVNRATPKTQSALLEAMEEGQVTADGETFRLPQPFFVVATQNPTYQIGTFPLPESQLDRFLMRIQLGYPGPAMERELLKGDDRRTLLTQSQPAVSAELIQQMQEKVKSVFASEALLDYLQSIVRHTREHTDYESGLSPRAAISLLRAAQAWALLHQRDAVLPEDIQAVLPAVVGHRLRPRQEAAGRDPDQLGRDLLEAVPIP
ncbi:MAG: MoxR family ATPase [Chromatiales bacterium]|jgi:MoxR-like ATPase|nr:MoxR family ATPase [Chromatiales bacterium]MDH4031047.1 MoxR family ATPase [Chromatiales bacterium]